MPNWTNDDGTSDFENRNTRGTSTRPKRRRKRPQAIVNCIADHYAAENERIIELVFPDGSGCLVSLRYDEDAARPCSISVYRATASRMVLSGNVP